MHRIIRTAGIVVGLGALLVGAKLWQAATGEAAAEREPRVVIVKMIGHGETFRFEPARVEVRRGDVVRFVHTGEMLHNVQFVEGKIPRGANLKDYWISPFLPDHGREYDLSIDARFLVGTYSFICTPHAPWDMEGEIVVEA
jgi:plastocyanin